MMKQRMHDIDFKQEIRAKLNKHEAQTKELQDKLKAQRQQHEQLQNDHKDLENRMRTQERKAKEEYAKLMAERNELIQTVTKVQNKETQSRHELRNKDI